MAVEPILTLTTTADFQAVTWADADDEDYSVDGQVSVAAAASQILGTYATSYSGYSADCMKKLIVRGYAPGAAVVAGRIRLATTQAGLSAATWSPWGGSWTPGLAYDPETGLISPRADGYGEMLYEVWKAVANGDLVDAGPWYEVQLLAAKG